MTQPRETTLQDVAAAKAAYDAARQELARIVGELFTNAPDVTEVLVSRADEFGPQHAVSQLLARPEDFGRVREGQSISAKASVLHERLEAVLDRHDGLDLANAGLERTNTNRDAQVVHIDGRPYDIDRATAQIKSVAQSRDREPSLIYRAVRDAGVEPAKPNPTRDKDRSR